MKTTDKSRLKTTVLTQSLCLSIVAGILFGLSQAVVDCGIFTILALVLLGYSINSSQNPVLDLFSFGLFAYGIGLLWMTHFGYVPWAILTLYHVLYLLPVGLLIKLIPSRQSALFTFVLAGLLCLSEWLRSLSPYGVSMATFSGPFAHNIAAVQLAGLVGAIGMTWFVCLFGIRIGICLGCRRYKSIVLPAAAFILIHTFGLWQLQSYRADETKVKVAAIQGATTDGFKDLVQQDHKMDTYLDISEKAVRQGAKLLVWPETSVPGDMANGSDNYYLMTSRFAGMETPALVGGFVTTQTAIGKELRNVVFGFGPQGELAGVYEKTRLTPFGEFVPFRDHLPDLSRWGVLKYDIDIGRYWPPIESGPFKAGVLICSESMFSSMSVQRVNDGANVLVIVSNDSWFGRGMGTEQLARVAIYRSVECGRSCIRASETGYSMLIGPNGRTIKKSDLYKREALVGEIELSTRKTLYVKYGVVFPYLIILITFVCLAVSLRRQKRKPESDPQQLAMDI